MRRLLLILPLAACADLTTVGQPPAFAPLTPNLEHHAL
jgi:hypothetical protein